MRVFQAKTCLCYRTLSVRTARHPPRACTPLCSRSATNLGCMQFEKSSQPALRVYKIFVKKPNASLEYVLQIDESLRQDTMVDMPLSSYMTASTVGAPRECAQTYGPYKTNSQSWVPGLDDKTAKISKHWEYSQKNGEVNLKRYNDFLE